MTHGNAPLSVEGRRRLVARCADRPIAHVAAEMGISRACASKWVNRFRQFGEIGLLDRFLCSTPPAHRDRRGACRRDRDLTPCVGHAQSQECAGGSEMIQPDGKEELPR